MINKSTAERNFYLCVELIKKHDDKSNNKIIELLNDCPEAIISKGPPHFGVTLIMEAVNHNNLAALKLILEHLACTKEIINWENNSGRTALFIAACKCSTEILSILVNVNGIDLEITDNTGYTALQYTLLGIPNIEVAKILIKAGANINVKDNNGDTPLIISARNGRIALFELLFNAGADPYIENNSGDSTLNYAIDSENMHSFFNVIWSKEHNTKLLYNYVINNKVSKMQDILSKTHFKEIDLKFMFLMLIKMRKFALTDIILNSKFGLMNLYKTRALLPLSTSKLSPNMQKEVLSWVYNTMYKHLESSLVFENTPFHDKKELILQTFASIRKLLHDIPKCIKLLQPLENALKINIPGLSKIKSCEYITINRLKWPVIPEEGYPSVDKRGLLRLLLRDYLQRYGIETQDELYTFAGFVDTEEANKIVRSGALFKEQFLMGNALVHGVYTHYIQWYLIVRAFEKGYIKSDLTPKDLLQASVDIRTKSGVTLWTRIVDAVSHEEKPEGCVEYGLSSPHEMSSFLYNQEILPNIAKYLCHSLHRSLENIRVVLSKKISNNSIIAGQAMANSEFSLFKLGFTVEQDVTGYYEKHSKTGKRARVDLNTGIIRKKPNIRS